MEAVQETKVITLCCFTYKVCVYQKAHLAYLSETISGLQLMCFLLLEEDCVWHKLGRTIRTLYSFVSNKLVS